MLKEIVVVAPIENMYNMVLEIIDERSYKNVDVVLGNLGKGLMVAKESISNGAKIIVTRGGTYRMIKESCKVPVVEIQVNAYDIIESLEQVPTQETTIGIVGFSNVIYGVGLLKKMINQQIEVIEIRREEDIYEVIQMHKERGIRTYVGDANIIRIAHELGCKGIPIGSQKEFIHAAITEAQRMLYITKEAKHRTHQMTMMTNSIRDGIIAVDELGCITVFNKMISDILGISQEKAIGKYVADLLPNTRIHHVLQTGVQELGEIQNIKNTQMITNHIPICVDGEVKGAVVTFQDIPQIQKLEQKIRHNLRQKGFTAKYNFTDIIYSSVSMERCIETAKKFSMYDTPVHIYGESGVGKELFCQSMHNYSPRKNEPFVAVNCATIPPSLIESELFGYAEGSFTGAARKGRAGIFELAHNGTLFLDEISEIPMELQSRLLRILQERQVMRVGGDRLIPVNIKIITASNQHLKNMVVLGKFRKDLFYRINVLTLNIPSLNSRTEDIPLLAKHFFKKYSNKYNKQPIEISDSVEALLMSQNFDGNVRELEGLIEKCVILSSFDSLFFKENQEADILAANIETNYWKDGILDLSLADMERNYIRDVFNQNNQNVKKTCSVLGIGRTTLWRKIKEQL